MQLKRVQIFGLQCDKFSLVFFLGSINPNKYGNNFKTIKLEMNGYITITQWRL